MLNKSKRFIKNWIVSRYPKQTIDDVLQFCKTAQTLRNGRNCSEYYDHKYSEKMCDWIISYLFDQRRMGAYCLCEGSPQPLMRKWILDHNTNIGQDSYILEVGPGNNPLFDENEYPNWHGCDYNYENGIINFSGQIWGEGKYTKCINGSWENLTTAYKDTELEGKFDLICGSHSFEHNHKPIQSLKEAWKMLKNGGLIVLFVPDGYSIWPGNYDKTHSLYMTKDMVEDFFDAAGGWTEVSCHQFRTNMDLVITAKKNEKG